MLDRKLIEQYPEEIAQRLATRGVDFDIVQFKKLHTDWKTAESTTQELRAQHKLISKKIGGLIQSGMSPEAAKQSIQASLIEIESTLCVSEQQAKQYHQQLEAVLMNTPNVPDKDVPVGQSEADNLCIATRGAPPVFDFPIKDHVELGQSLDGMDFQSAAKIAGARFVLLKGKLARLHRALTQFMLDIHTEVHGYEELYVPVIVNKDSLMGTGQLPRFEEELFKLQHDSDYYLIPTAEVPVTNYLRDESLSEKDLPRRYVAHTPCFRSEAGSYGKDTKGMIRQHQFDKVELVQIVAQHQSDEAFQHLLQAAERILECLSLPYQVVQLCTADLGFSAATTYDLEVWLPSQQCYREISSCSNFRDYQARRSNIKYKDASGKRCFAHTLNASGLAVGRTLVALLENHQTVDGSIYIPEPLRGYLGGCSSIIP